MRVAFLNHSTAAVHLGGAERSLLRFVAEWKRRNPALETHFVTKQPAGLFVDELEARGWSYSLVPFRGWIVPAVGSSAGATGRVESRDAESVAAVIAILDDFRPDLVVTNTLVVPWGAVAAAALGIPHAWMVREFADLDATQVFAVGADAAYSDISALSRVVIANSRTLRDHLAATVDADKLTFAYPRIDRDAEGAHAEPRPESGTASELRLVTVGRVSPEKGQHRVVAAVGELHRRGVEATLSLVGAATDADYARQLEELADRLGVADRVRFAGERPDPFPEVDAADVVVNPSTIETFGRTTLEGMTRGRPVVALAGGAAAELVVDGTTGFVIDPEDTGLLADRLAEYAGSPELRRRHGEAGALRARELSEAHSDAAVIERLESLQGAGPAIELPAVVAALLAASRPAVDARPFPRLRALRRAILARLRRSPAARTGRTA